MAAFYEPSFTDAQHLAIQKEKPIGISKRRRCSECGKTMSIGQFIGDSQVCIKHGNVPKNFRRGGL